MRTFPVVSLFVISTLAGCLDAGPDTDLDSGAPEEASETSAVVACLVPPNPPPADIGWGLVAGEDKTFVVNNYGTTGCSRITFSFGPATEISGTVANALTLPTTCEQTSVTGRFYQQVGSTWTYLGSKTATGVWQDFVGCIEPKIRYEVPASGADHGQSAVTAMRLYMSASRTTCTTGTPQLCGTTYGLPVSSTGGRHEHF